MSRHASAKELASYAGGALPPRRAARIAAHLAGCAQCSEHLKALLNVSGLLASVPFAPIPDRLSARIEMAIVSESATRVTSTPASEAGRRDVPARAGRAGHGRRRWQPPRLSSPVALRVVAAAGAAALVAGGGYEIAAHLGQPGAESASSSSPNRPATVPHAPATKLRFGPRVSYEYGGHEHSIVTVESSTDFRASALQTQTLSALDADRTASQSPTASRLPNVYNGTSSSADNSQSNVASPPAVLPLSQLPGCLGLIVAGHNVLLVELASYEGNPAAIIVLGVTDDRPSEVVAVGARCSATTPDVLARRPLRSG